MHCAFVVTFTFCFVWWEIKMLLVGVFSMRNGFFTSPKRIQLRNEMIRSTASSVVFCFESHALRLFLWNLLYVRTTTTWSDRSRQRKNEKKSQPIDKLMSHHCRGIYFILFATYLGNLLVERKNKRRECVRQPCRRENSLRLYIIYSDNVSSVGYQSCSDYDAYWITF